MCGPGAYDPTEYNSCASTIASTGCATFQLRFQTSGLCLARTRWSVRAVICDAQDTMQDWILSQEGHLFGRGVLSSVESFRDELFFTAGVLEGNTTMALQNPDLSQADQSLFSPVAFQPQTDNTLHGSISTSALCIAHSPELGLEVSFTFWDPSTEQEPLNCARFQIF